MEKYKRAYETFFYPCERPRYVETHECYSVGTDTMVYDVWQDNYGTEITLFIKDAVVLLPKDEIESVIEDIERGREKSRQVLLGPIPDGWEDKVYNYPIFLKKRENKFQDLEDYDFIQCDSCLNWGIRESVWDDTMIDCTIYIHTNGGGIVEESLRPIYPSSTTKNGICKECKDKSHI